MTTPPHPRPHAPSVLAVVLNWNSFPETCSALESLLAMDYPNVSILLVDNGSTDGSAHRLDALVCPRVRVLHNSENIGYTGGCNQGIEMALGRGDDFIWLFNSDAIAAPDTLSSLVRCAQQDPRLALVSPRIHSLQNPRKPLNLGGVFDPSIPAFQSTRDPDLALQQSARTPDRIIVMGTALLLRTSAIREIGSFDERFFAYWEDSDLSVRSIHAGFRNAVDLHSTVLHAEKDSATEANSMKPHFWYYMARNEVRFWRKHASGISCLKALWWSLQGNRAHLLRLGGDRQSQQALVAGLWDGWVSRTGPWHTSRRAPALLEWLLLSRSPTAVPTSC